MTALTPNTKQLVLFAKEALPYWDIDQDASVDLINISENATFRIDSPAHRPVILRIHRENYHTKKGIESELIWMEALRHQANVSTPQAIPGKNRQLIQKHNSPLLPNPRHLVLFEFVPGQTPQESDDLRALFVRLGKISARLHAHVEHWRLPTGFERLTWDEHHILGHNPNWGNWRHGPAVTNGIREQLELLETQLLARLHQFGKSRSRFGLIHADLRLANLLIDNDKTHVIDFDDCGMGWFLYDLATALSFFEDHPQVPALIESWLTGYRTIRSLSSEEENEIPTFIMLRRLALLAWVGSHSDTELAREKGVGFAAVTSQLARQYLKQQPE